MAFAAVASSPSERLVRFRGMMASLNDRNYRFFLIGLALAFMGTGLLLSFIPSEVVAVAESGMKTAADIALIRQASFDAVLIGEGLHTSAELRDVIWS